MGLSFSPVLRIPRTRVGRSPLRLGAEKMRFRRSPAPLGLKMPFRVWIFYLGGMAAALAAQGELRSPPPQGAALPPVSALGSDVSELPILYPDGNWLPLDGPARAMEPRVRVSLNGRQVIAVLDTGAMTSLMSQPMAEKLGLAHLVRAGKSVKVMDSHGEMALGHRVAVPRVSLRRHEWVNAEFLVFGVQPDLLLIGADLLQDVDILLAAEEGWVGLFDGGRAPELPNEVVIPVRKTRRQLNVAAFARSARHALVPFTLVVDSGATHTSVPAWTGINSGLPADLKYAVQTISVGGAQEARGRFVLDPLWLGPAMHKVGLVLALPSTIHNGEGEALLGNDVLLRNLTLISFQKEEVRVVPSPARPPYRVLGPGGVRCPNSTRPEKACLEVRLDTPADVQPRPDALPGICLAVDAAPAYAGQSLELTITALDEKDREIFAGGVLRALVTVGSQGLQKCFPLWPHLAHLGLKADSRLSLRWVRGEGFRWPCDAEQTECLAFTGPMAPLPTKASVATEFSGIWQ